MITKGRTECGKGTVMVVVNERVALQVKIEMNVGIIKVVSSSKCYESYFSNNERPQKDVTMRECGEV